MINCLYFNYFISILKINLDSLNVSPEINKYRTFSSQLEIPTCKTHESKPLTKHDFQNVMSNLVCCTGFIIFCIESFII